MLIKLTNPGGMTVFINPAHIVTVSNMTDKITMVRCLDGLRYDIRETPQEVADLVNYGGSVLTNEMKDLPTQANPSNIGFGLAL